MKGRAGNGGQRGGSTRHRRRLPTKAGRRFTGGFCNRLYLGGGDDDESAGIAVDSAGNIYVSGMTRSLDFPTRGGVRSTGFGDEDAFVVRWSQCTPLPSRVEALKGVKLWPTDVGFSWNPEPSSAGGYHLYVVSAKGLIPTANASGLLACEASGGQTSCQHTGGLPSPPGEIYYQVVGLCSDGISEGPI